MPQKVGDHVAMLFLSVKVEIPNMFKHTLFLGTRIMPQKVSDHAAMLAVP